MMSGTLMGWRGSEWRKRAARGGLNRVNGADGRVQGERGDRRGGRGSCGVCSTSPGLGMRQWSQGDIGDLLDMVLQARSKRGKCSMVEVTQW